MATNYDVLENEEIEEVKPTGLPEVIMSEEDLIMGLLEAADYETAEETMQPVEIRRKGKLLFQFRVHPLSEKDMMRLRRQATPRINNPAGRGLPKIDGEMNVAEFRSRKIYAATVEEDKAKTWDNPKLKASLKAKGKDIIENWEIIDYVFMGGEKFAVSELIDDISGYNDEQIGQEEYAKN